MKWIAFIIGSSIFLLMIIASGQFRDWLMLPLSPKRRRARKNLKYWLAVRKFGQDTINSANDEIRQLRKR